MDYPRLVVLVKMIYFTVDFTKYNPFILKPQAAALGVFCDLNFVFL